MSSPMTGVRIRTAAVGSAVAASAAIVVAYGSVLGSDLPKVALLGVAAGAVLGLVPGRAGDAGARALAFVGGFIAVAVGLALLRSSLPDIPTGRAISAVVVLSLVTALATASGDRLPLWAGLLGVATLTGAFQTVLAGAATGTTTTVVTAATSALLASGLAFFATTLLAGLASPMTRSAAEPPGEPLDVDFPLPRAAADSTAGSHVKAV